MAAVMVTVDGRLVHIVVVYVANVVDRRHGLLAF